MNRELAQYRYHNFEILGRKDRIWRNNPVVMQGAGVAPLIMAAVNGQNAHILVLASILLITPTRFLGALLSKYLPHKYSIWYYAGVAGVLFIPVYLLLRNLYGNALLALGIYLPIMVMDPLVVRRYANEKPEDLRSALKRGIGTTVGYGIIVMLSGLGREFLAHGTMMGNPILNTPLFPLADQPAGGFILLGVFCAVWRSSIELYKQYLKQEANRPYE